MTHIESFILVVLIILSVLLYKSWEKIKKIFTEREDTAVKRTNEINNINNSIYDVRNEIKSYKSEHAIEHKHMEKDISIIRDSLVEIQRDLKGFGASVSKIHGKIDRFFFKEK